MYLGSPSCWKTSSSTGGISPRRHVASMLRISLVSRMPMYYSEFILPTMCAIAQGPDQLNQPKIILLLPPNFNAPVASCSRNIWLSLRLLHHTPSLQSRLILVPLKCVIFIQSSEFHFLYLGAKNNLFLRSYSEKISFICFF